jgi:hypothetical protein
MSRLYDRANNKWVDVPDSDVTDLVGSGKYAFPKGIRVPVVVTEDGGLGDIASEEAEQAFKSGQYRWGTHQDALVNQEKGEEASNERIYGTDQTINAGVQGLVRGQTFGTSDVIMPAMGALVGKEDEVREGLKQTKERNPFPSAVGEITGAVTGGPGALIKTGKEAIGLAREAATPLRELSTLGKVAETAPGLGSRIATKIAENAAEGLVYGIGDGISEAALGDPSQVAENLAASPVYGALFGGAFGAGFGALSEVAPYAKVFIGKAGEAINDSVQSAARKVTKGALVPTLSVMGKKELAAIAGELVDHPEIRKAYEEGGAEKVRGIMRDLGKAQDILSGERKALRSELRAYVKDAPKELQKDLDRRIAEVGGDLSAATKSTFDQLTGERATLRAAMDGDVSQSSRIGDLQDQVTKVFEDLKATGDMKARREASRIKTWIDAQLAGKSTGLVRGSRLPGEALLGTAAHVSNGLESRLAYELREMANGAIAGKTQPSTAKLLKSFSDNMTDFLHSNPVFGEQAAKIDKVHDAFEKFRGFATGAAKTAANTNVKASVLNRIIGDPAAAAEFDTLLSNISQFAPELEAFRSAGKDIIQRGRVAEQVASKIGALRKNALGQGLSLDAIEEALTSLNVPKDILDRGARLREVETALQATEGGTAAKYLNVQKALGHTIDKSLVDLLKYEDGFAKIEKHFPQGTEKGVLRSLLSAITKPTLRGALGATVGGYLGDKEGAIAGGFIGAASKPYHVLKALTKLEAASSKSFGTMTKVVNKAIDSLTGETFRKASVSGLSQKPGNTLNDRRKNFKKRAQFLTQMSDVNNMADEIENRIGDMRDTPMIGSALASQFAKTAQFLQSKVPSDPIMAQSITAGRSPWEPSDYELAKFERYVEAAEDPERVLTKIASGSVSPEHIETLKVLYPSTYQRLQDGVMDAIMKPNTKLSYEQRINIGSLLDIPTDPTLQTSFVTAMQANYQPDPGRPAGSDSPQKQGRPAHIDINPKATMTEAQRITYS